MSVRKFTKVVLKSEEDYANGLINEAEFCAICKAGIDEFASQVLSRAVDDIEALGLEVTLKDKDGNVR